MLGGGGVTLSCSGAKLEDVIPKLYSARKAVTALPRTTLLVAAVSHNPWNGIVARYWTLTRLVAGAAILNRVV